MTDAVDRAPEAAHGGSARAALQLGLGALWYLFFGVVIFIAVVLGVIPFARGDRAYIVTGASMEPTIPQGATVVVATQIDRFALDVGDVISFVDRSQLVITHRISALTRDGRGIGYATKGDANTVIDPELVRPPSVLGRVRFHVPYVGYALAYTATWQTAVLVALSVIVILYQLGRKSNNPLNG